jgi:hypothetical protein
MKKIVLSALTFCAFSLGVFAQDDAVQKAAADAAAELSQAPQEEVATPKPNYWSSSLQVNLGYNMTNLSNWAAGGYNTVTLTTNLDASANYARDLMSWNNRLQLDYGFLYSNEKENILQKSNDRIYFESKWAYQTSSGSKFNYTASFNFRSQFSDTPDKYSQDENGKWYEDGIKSGFISPAYTDIALGIQWKPSNWFDLNFAPLTGGFTICSNEALRASYGMKTKADGVTYNSALFQFGAQLKANLKVSINDNFSYETQGVIFTDYLNEPYFRVNWDNAINWQVSKYIKFAFKTWLIYDPNVTITDTLEDGTTSTRQRGVQFKDFLSFSFTYTIASKK